MEVSTGRAVRGDTGAGLCYNAPMNDLLIRPYAPADWAQIEAIHDAARMIELRAAGLADAYIPLAVAAVREGLFEYTVRVAEADGQVAGFAAYTDDELAWLYVDPARMRRGIGSALIRHALGDTARPLHIEVLAGNEAALRAYEKHGFAQAETLTGRMPGNEAFAVTVHCLRLD